METTIDHHDIIEKQQTLIKSYKALLESVDARDKQLADYLEKIRLLLLTNNGDTLYIGTSHLEGIITSIRKRFI